MKGCAYTLNKIVVRHSSIVINNYEWGDCPKLEYFFSVYDMITHKYLYKAIEYIEEEKKLILPRGLDIYFLENMFQTTAYVDYDFDKFDHTEPIMIKYLPRDQVQKQALRFVLGEGEYTYTKNRSQLSLNLNTGKGKTYVAIAAAAYSCLRSMTITSSLGWLDQWKKCILDYTDTKESEIYLISGSGSIARLLNGMRDPSKIKFFLASHDTLKSYGDKYGWDKITELFKLLKIGIKFFDEAHLNFDNLCKIDFYTNTRCTVYLTATPKRSNEDEDTIYQLSFKNVPAIDLFDEDNDPHTQYIAMHYNSHPSPMDISDCKNQYGLDRNKYTKYIVNQDQFYMLMNVLMSMIKKLNGKALIYIGTNASIDVVKEWLCENYPEMKHNIGVYTSVIDKDIKEQQLEKKIILSTTKSCGAAMDIKNLKMTIVLAEPFKSEVLARQTLGRTRSDNTYYIEIVDTGFFYIKKYYTYKKPIFSKYATKCSDVKFTDEELVRKSNEFLELRKTLTVPVIHYEAFPLVSPIIRY